MVSEWEKIMDKHLNIDIKDTVRLSKKKPASSQSKNTDDQAIEQVRKIVLKNRRISTKNNQKKKKAPLKLILTCALLLAVASYGHFNYKELDAFLSKIEISIFSKTLAKEEKAATSKSGDTKKVPTNKGTDVAAKSKEKTSWTQEEINIFKGLEDRNKQLDEREKSLNVLAEELQKQRAELDGKLKKLEDVRENISKTLGEQVEKDEEKLNKLVEVYSNMKPNNAAKVFESLDENLAVDVLTRMKKDRAANILNLIEPQKARRLSEKFAGYVRK